MNEPNDGLPSLEDAVAAARALERGDRPPVSELRALTGVPPEDLFGQYRLLLPPDWVADEVFVALERLEGMLENTYPIGPALEEHPALFRSVIDIAALLEMVKAKREADLEEEYARTEIKIRETKPKATIGEVQSTALLDYPAYARHRMQVGILGVLVEHVGRLKSLAHSRESTLSKRSDREVEDQRDNKKAK